jgi:hypothetical protein
MLMFKERMIGDEKEAIQICSDRCSGILYAVQSVRFWYVSKFNVASTHKQKPVGLFNS